MADECTVRVGGKTRADKLLCHGGDKVSQQLSLSLGLIWSMVVILEATSQLHPEECRKGSTNEKTG